MSPTRRDVLSGLVGFGSLAGLSTLAGCSAPVVTDGGSDVTGSVLASDVERETSQVPDDDVTGLVDGVTDFACDLHRRRATAGGNQFVSPYSLAVALAMTWGGARGTTEREMADTLRFPFEQERLHAAMNALDRAVRGADENDTDTEGRPFTLRVANAMWAQTGYPFHEAYLDLLAQNYGAGVRTLDFTTAPEPARRRINEWVANQTEDNIEELLPPGTVTADTRFVLTNALYFLADWQHQFQAAATEDRPFTALDDSRSPVKTMHQRLTVPYAEVDGHQLVDLPYVGETVSMLVLLPAEGEFESVEGELDAERVEALVAALESREGTLALPKFTVRADVSLPETLAAMGMPSAFDPQAANFEGMTDDTRLSLSDVLHETFVAVDEQGTEAAAATAVVGGVSSAPMNPFSMIVDRPFLVFIRHRETGALLFLGRIVDADAAQ